MQKQWHLLSKAHRPTVQPNYWTYEETFGRQFNPSVSYYNEYFTMSLMLTLYGLLKASESTAKGKGGRW